MRKSLIILLLPILFISCTKDNPILPDEEKPVNKALEIKIEEACKISNKVWLKVSLSDTLSKPGFVNIWRGNKGIANFYFSGQDTIIVDDKIKPGETVTYLGLIYSDTSKIYSNQLTTTTLDTTSHNITWKMYSLGDEGEVNDIEIVDENNILAVGYYYKNNEAFNLARWNGSEWNLEKIYLMNGKGIKYVGELYGIKYFNENDIWYVSNALEHWNGQEWQQYNLNPTYPCLYIYGNSSNNIYVAGVGGTFFHFDGNKLYDMTDQDLAKKNMNITALCGTPSGSRIWYTSYSDYLYTTKLCVYDGVNFNKIFDGRTYLGYFRGIWTSNEKNIYVGYSTSLISQYGTGKLDTVGIAYINYPIYGINGNDVNDIFINYGFGVGHFNGATTYIYKDLEYGNVYYAKVKTNKNITVVGGLYYTSKEIPLIIISKKTSGNK